MSTLAETGHALLTQLLTLYSTNVQHINTIYTHSNKICSRNITQPYNYIHIIQRQKGHNIAFKMHFHYKEQQRIKKKTRQETPGA